MLLGDSAMTPDDLRQLLQLHPKTFQNLQALGRFEQWELVPRLGHRLRRYSRKAVQAYLDREETPAGIRVRSKLKTVR